MIKKSLSPFYKVKADQVDPAAGVIKGIVIIEEGKDKYGDHFDVFALKQLAQMGNQQGQGVKSRFGHPNMCDSALGSYIGRYKNFRVDYIEGLSEQRSAVMADLYLDEVAKRSPKGDLYSYTIEMAQKNDDMFGNSIVFMPDAPMYKEETDKDGNLIEVRYERFKSFIASDLVDSPAATTSLFKSSNDFAALATDFLDDNPEIFELLSKDDGRLMKEFLTKYKSYLLRKDEK